MSLFSSFICWVLDNHDVDDVDEDIFFNCTDMKVESNCRRCECDLVLSKIINDDEHYYIEEGTLKHEW